MSPASDLKRQPATPIRPFGSFGPLRPFPPVTCSPRHSLQNSKISVAKRSKTAPKRPKTVTTTSNMAPNRSKNPRKRSRNGPIPTARMTHYHSIQYMSHAHTTVYCIHLRPPARLTTRSAQKSVCRKSRNHRNRRRTHLGPPPIPVWGALSGRGGWGDSGRGAGETKSHSSDIMLV